MSKTLFEQAVSTVEALNNKNINIVRIADMTMYKFDEDIRCGGITLPPGKYVEAKVTLWTGPFLIEDENE